MPDDAQLADSWFVLSVEPQAEQRVAKRADALAIEAYFPIGVKAAPNRRKRKLEIDMRERPAMPGYVFVRMADRRFDRFRRAFDAPDAVGHCLGFLGADEPSAIPETVVESLRERQANGEFDTHVKQGRYSAPRWVRSGASVRIVQGPFKGLCGEIWRMTRARMVAIWLTIMGTPRLVEAPLEWVAKAR